jgi:hypothetical protein
MARLAQHQCSISVLLERWADRSGQVNCGRVNMPRSMFYFKFIKASLKQTAGRVAVARAAEFTEFEERLVGRPFV